MQKQLFNTGELNSHQIQQPLKTCKTCKNCQRWHTYDERPLGYYCGSQRSGRTINGLLKILTSRPACALYEVE